MSAVLQLTPLPLPVGYTPPSDLTIVPAFDDAALAAVDASAVRAVITHSIKGAPAPLLALFPNLKLVANFGVGLDRIDLPTAKARGIAVSYTPDHLTNDVADLGLTLALSLLRRIPAADAYVRRNGWATGPNPLGVSATGRKVGILGMGRIGKAMARRGAAFAMLVGYTARTAKADVQGQFFDSVLDLAEWADVLIAAVPGGADTDKMVSADVLKALGPQGVFVNVARSSVVDETALAAALHGGQIGGAGLELFEATSGLPVALKGVDNVIFTPHIGSATWQTRAAMADSVFANVRSLLKGEPLTDLVP
jgi:hydroxypyruvate reductase